VPAAVSFLEPVPAAVSFLEPAPDVYKQVDDAVAELRRIPPESRAARDKATAIVKVSGCLSPADRIYYQALVADILGWSKRQLASVQSDIKKEEKEKASLRPGDFYAGFVFVKELNCFYEFRTRLFHSVEAFTNACCDQDPEVRKAALVEGMVRKVDCADYAPRMPVIFQRGPSTILNLWDEQSMESGTPGDCSPWIDHFEQMGWEEHRKHIEQWMAYTLRYPEKKINHILLLGSGEGTGKDFLLYPLMKAMGQNAEVIAGEELLSNYQDYLLNTKYLHINEAELGTRREALSISNRLKPLAAAPPHTLRVNQKFIKPLRIQNVVNVSMTTNSALPLRLMGPSRRYFAIWSALNLRGPDGDVTPDWRNYWSNRWGWMYNGGWEAVVDYLLHTVDLSDFDPEAAPPTTEFLQSIQEDSKSGLQKLIETLIARKTGCFISDIVAEPDIINTIRPVIMMQPEWSHLKADQITPQMINIVMRQLGYAPARVGMFGYKVQAWILRNKDYHLGSNNATMSMNYREQIGRAVIPRGNTLVPNREE
jgi:hypothetical protein